MGRTSTNTIVSTTEFRLARADEYRTIRALLASQGLPSEDVVQSDASRFYLAEYGAMPIGCAGLECYGADALLRSVAVDPSYRGHGLGRQLVGTAERDAAALGVKRLFLLTTNAAEYFQRFGYLPCDRGTVPIALQSSSQFSQVCPASAVCMWKQLGGAD